MDIDLTEEIIDKARYEKLAGNAIILGFTGALGSGCTYFSEGLMNFHHYYYFSLSKYIHQKIEEKEDECPDNLQNIGNKLREKHGRHILAYLAAQEAEEKLKKDKYEGKQQKIVIDGIRNTGEVEFFKQFPNFFLISIQAEKNKRKKRLIDDGRCKDEEEFEKADERDKGERLPHGQQVKKCNYLADIIIINEEFKSKKDDLYRKYVYDKLYDKYVCYVERMAERLDEKIERKRIPHVPSDDEALMTSAYVESKRSHCLKRKVGAVITTKDNFILSAGHNDPPLDEPPCKEHPLYEWCARDVLLEPMGKAINNCPNCGKVLYIDTTCIYCKENIKEYEKRCRHCDNDPAVEHICPKCGVNVFLEYLPGGKPDTGKMLDMCRSLHAEENAILNLSRAGISATLADKIYTTTFPCNLCANRILQVGIKEVIYAEPYDTKETKELLERKKVNVRRFEGIKSSAYFKLFS